MGLIPSTAGNPNAEPGSIWRHPTYLALCNPTLFSLSSFNSYQPFQPTKVPLPFPVSPQNFPAAQLLHCSVALYLFPASPFPPSLCRLTVTLFYPTAQTWEIRELSLTRKVVSWLVQQTKGLSTAIRPTMASASNAQNVIRR